MPHSGMLGNHKFEDVEDVRGAEIYGVNNEKLGTIKDIVFSHSSGQIQYAVVDAGGWFSSKRFLLPVHYLQPYGRHQDRFYADLDRERVHFLPEFKDELLGSESAWADYEKRYQERWNDGVVLYNQETNRIVTPPMDQVEGGRAEPLSEEEKRSLQRDFTPRKMGREDELLGVASNRDFTALHPEKPSIAGARDVASERSGEKEMEIYRVDEARSDASREQGREPRNAGGGPRWTGIQQKIHERRDEIVSECPLCGTQEKVA